MPIQSISDKSSSLRALSTYLSSIDHSLWSEIPVSSLTLLIGIDIHSCMSKASNSKVSPDTLPSHGVLIKVTFPSLFLILGTRACR